jgi:hypothetical protein
VPGECCAYCGEPLRLIAGFCATCQAPAGVAQRAGLIAQSGLGTAHRVAVRPLAPLPPIARPAPIVTRLLLAGGLIALGAVLVLVSLRLHANPLRLLIPPPEGAIVATQPPGGASTTQIIAGQPFALEYSATVERASAQVMLTIAPTTAPACSLVEGWPQGTTSREQILVPLAPDRWRITLQRDGQTIATLTVTIISGT